MSTYSEHGVEISIIIPTYNYANYIHVCIDSLLQQTYKNIEIIVVDDGSTDDTAKTIKSYSDSRIKYIYQDNNGASSARNNGFKNSSGKLLFFLDSDDFYHPRHIEEYVKEAQLNPGCNIYGPWGCYRKQGADYICLYKKGKPETEDLLFHWLNDWWIASCCILWTRGNLQKSGLWDESLKADQDGDLAMRAIIEGIPFVYAPSAPLANIIDHEIEQPSVSRTPSPDTLLSRLCVINKVQKALENKNFFSIRYRYALADRCYGFAYRNARVNPELCDLFFSKYRELKGFRRPPGSVANWVFVNLLGIKGKEELSYSIERFRTYLQQKGS